jgi:hypothetical protein
MLTSGVLPPVAPNYRVLLNVCPFIRINRALFGDAAAVAQDSDKPSKPWKET